MGEYSKLHCSFCGKPATEVKKLIAGPDVYICNECVDKCHGILNTAPAKPASDDTASASTGDGAKLPTPSEIKAFLDQYVIGQDHAKEVLAVAVYNHYLRLENPVVDGVEIEKSNILLCGPTGVGKTLLAQTVARMLDVPFCIADATSLTEAGYVGEDVESIISRLLQAADYDVKRAERGIIFIDEIDKKRSKGDGGSSSRDVSGEGVQQALLKMLEGSDVLVTPQGGRKNPNSEMIKVNTRNILFVVGGAFVGLDKIIEKSLTKDQVGMGFGAKTITRIKLETVELLKQIEPDHLVQFGLIPELIGRLPVIVALSDLDEGQLVRVLTEPKNALVKQFVARFKLVGVELEFTPEALLAAARIARKRKTGGRALRSVIETKLNRISFDLPDLRKQGATKVVVGEAVITEGAQPEVIYAEDGTSD